jgi:hypothetical protein
MSNRQRQSHRAKEQKAQRYFPRLTQDEIETRLNVLEVTISLIQEALTDLGNPAQVHPEGQLAMRGAHLTISHWMLERLGAELVHDPTR